MFDEQACTQCGICLHKCPFMELPLTEAKEEIVRAIAGSPSQRLLESCASCLACTELCPQGNDPYDLILSLLEKRYRATGMPRKGGVLLPYLQPNLWSYVQARLPADEKQLLTDWESPCEADEILFPGCNTSLLPFITQTKLLDGMKIHGSQKLCCGTYYYQMGFMDATKEIAERLQTHFKKMGLQRMVTFCAGCNYMFGRFHPEKLGVDHGFEVVHLLEVLRERIDSGKIKITNSLSGTAAVHDPCFFRPYNDKFYDLARDLLSMLGLTPVEMRHNRKTSLCCGLGCGCTTFEVERMAKVAHRRVEEGLATRADIFVTFCTGCTHMLSTAKRLWPDSQPLHYFLELLQKATGEQPVARERERADDFITATALYKCASYMGRFHGRMWLEPIAANPNQFPQWKDRIALLKPLEPLIAAKFLRPVLLTFFKGVIGAKGMFSKAQKVE
ncbi:MAG: (Fe-S)-binding protein [Desulfomonilia bacterium]